MWWKDRERAFDCVLISGLRSGFEIGGCMSAVRGGVTTRRGFASCPWRPDGRPGTTGKPWCLSTSCVFITVKPPSKLTAPRIAVCAAGSAVSMVTQKKIRERAGGSTCPLVVEKSNRRHVCLSLGQRLTQWQLLDQLLQTGCWFDSPLCSHDLLSGPLVWKLQQIGGCRVHHTDPGIETEKRAQGRFKTCQRSHTSVLNTHYLSKKKKKKRKKQYEETCKLYIQWQIIFLMFACVRHNLA